MRVVEREPQTELDPLGLWIFKDILLFGPRLIVEGFRQVRCWELLGELNVPVCASALAFLAEHEKAVDREELMQHCAHLSWARLKDQLALLDGVLLLGVDGERVTLMEPFRLRLRWMLGQDPGTRKRPESKRPGRPPPFAEPTRSTEPEKLSAYEILGLPASASLVEIRRAYRKRMKQCHPDLFAGMDQRARALAERWSRALNAAYATLNPKNTGGRTASNARR